MVTLMTFLSHAECKWHVAGRLHVKKIHLTPLWAFLVWIYQLPMVRVLAVHSSVLSASFSTQRKMVIDFF